MRLQYEDFVKTALNALNESGVEYVIIGGLAAIFYGRPRTSLDVDIIVSVKIENLEDFHKFLENKGFDIDYNDLLSSLKEKSHASIFLSEYPFRIDLKGVYDSLDRASMQNRRREKIFGVTAWIESPEDLVIAKLCYGSQQDIEDIRAVLKRQKLNMKYLEKRSKEEGVLAKLKNVLSDKT